MPRCAREKNTSGFYHICVRGNNRQDIFLDDSDREEYLIRLNQYKERYKIRIFAYCLMTNHVHLLIYDNGQDISKFMQGLSLSYVIYFNKRYKRTGHLFQDRFTSVPIKGDIQLLIASKYIHLNPIKARIVSRAGDYKWSSYKAYLKRQDKQGIVDTYFLSKMISQSVSKGRKEYIQFIEDQGEWNDNDEIATTMEIKQVSETGLKAMKKLSYTQIYHILKEQYFGKSERVDENNEFRCRAKIIYLLGLFSRLTWVQIAKNLNISVAIVYRKVRDISYKMIENKTFCKEIDEIILGI